MGRTTLTQRHVGSLDPVQRAIAAAAWAIEPVQLFADSHSGLDDAGVRAAAGHGIAGEGQPLPYLDIIQRAFGDHDVGGIRAHFGAQSAEANAALGSHAYATGNDVAFAKDSPSLHLVAHEAAHVVQQRAGVHLSSAVGQVGDSYEQHADAVADLVVRGESAAALLGTPTTGASGAVVARRAGPSPSDPWVKHMPKIVIDVDGAARVGSPIKITITDKTGEELQAKQAKAGVAGARYDLSLIANPAVWKALPTLTDEGPRVSFVLEPITAGNTSVQADVIIRSPSGHRIEVITPPKRFAVANVDGTPARLGPEEEAYRTMEAIMKLLGAADLASLYVPDFYSSHVVSWSEAVHGTTHKTKKKLTRGERLDRVATLLPSTERILRVLSEKDQAAFKGFLPAVELLVASLDPHDERATESVEDDQFIKPSDSLETIRDALARAYEDVYDRRIDAAQDFAIAEGFEDPPGWNDVLIEVAISAVLGGVAGALGEKLATAVATNKVWQTAVKDAFKDGVKAAVKSGLKTAQSDGSIKGKSAFLFKQALVEALRIQKRDAALPFNRKIEAVGKASRSEGTSDEIAGLRLAITAEQFRHALYEAADASYGLQTTTMTEQWATRLAQGAFGTKERITGGKREQVTDMAKVAGEDSDLFRDLPGVLDLRAELLDGDLLMPTSATLAGLNDTLRAALRDRTLGELRVPMVIRATKRTEKETRYRLGELKPYKGFADVRLFIDETGVVAIGSETNDEGMAFLTEGDRDKHEGARTLVKSIAGTPLGTLLK